MYTGVGRHALALALLFGLFAPGLARVCGAAAGVDPMECCEMSTVCQPAASLEEARSCCDSRTSSRSASPALPRLTGQSILTALPAERLAIDVLPIAESARSNLRGAPLRLPPRDLVKLHSSYLI